MKTVMFDDREVQLLTGIVLDKDKEEALRFLTEVVWAGQPHLIRNCKN